MQALLEELQQHKDNTFTNNARGCFIINNATNFKFHIVSKSKWWKFCPILYEKMLPTAGCSTVFYGKDGLVFLSTAGLDVVMLSLCYHSVWESILEWCLSCLVLLLLHVFFTTSSHTFADTDGLGL